MNTQTVHRRERRTYRLTFEQPDHMVGLEVICRGPTRRQLFMITRLGYIDINDLDEESIQQLDVLCDEFAERIIEWNHADEAGQPLPATKATLDEEDWQFTFPLVQGWMLTVLGTTPEADEPDPTSTQLGQFEGRIWYFP